MALFFKVPVYSGRVAVCTSHEDYNKVYADLEPEPTDAEDTLELRGVSSRHLDKDKRSVYLVGVFDNGEDTLVHELVHVVFEMLTHSEIPITKRNEEVFAYLMDALYRESIQALRPGENPPAGH